MATPHCVMGSVGSGVMELNTGCPDESDMTAMPEDPMKFWKRLPCTIWKPFTKMSCFPFSM